MSGSMRLERHVGRVCAAAALLLVALAERAAAADPVRVPARIEWGASVCGDAQGFSSRVLRRTQRVVFVTRGEDVGVLLSIEPKGAGLDARVVMKTSAGRQIVSRSIASPDCDDALDALALVVAISLDGRAQELEHARSAPRRAPPRKRFPPAPPSRTETEPAPPPPSAEPAPAPSELPSPETSPPEPAAQPEPSPPQPEPAPEPPPPAPAEVVVQPPLPAPSPPQERDEPPAPDTTEPRTGLWWSVGVDAEMALSVAPRPMFGAGLWLDATWERQSFLSPSATLGVSHLRLEGYEHSDGEADFQLNTFRLALCPARVGNARLELRPCVTAASGDFKVGGRQTFEGRDVLERWAALGGVLRAVARLGPVELRASVGAEIPHDRDALRFVPQCSENECEDGIFHRVGAFSTRLDIGAGVTF